MGIIHEAKTANGELITADFDWYAGGDCPYNDSERSFAEGAVMGSVRREWANGLPATEEEYARRQGLIENILHTMCKRATRPYGWEGACIHVTVGGQRWQGEEDE